MKTATTKPAVPARRRAVVPSKDSLRDAFTDTTLMLERTRVELDSTKETLVEVRSSRDTLRSRVDGLLKQLDEEVKIREQLKVAKEDLAALVSSLQTLVVTMRANLQVERARGYIDGMKGEPFETPLIMRGYDAADTHKGIDPWGGATASEIRHDDDRHMTPKEKLNAARRLVGFPSLA